MITQLVEGKTKNSELRDAALAAASFLFRTFQFRRDNKVTEEAWEIHDMLIHALDMEDDSQ